MSSPTKWLVRPIIIGDSGVGKTALLFKYVDGSFRQDYKATIGADFMTKEISAVCNKRNYLITTQLWDTAGQERFLSLGNAFYRGADAVIIVYDITNKESFDRIEFWKNEFINRTGDIDFGYGVPMLLLANKCDLVEESWRKLSHKYQDNYPLEELFVFGFCRESGVEIRDIMKLCLEYHGHGTFYDGSQFAKKHNMLYYEVSALTGYNIKKAMREIITKSVERPAVPFHVEEVESNDVLNNTGMSDSYKYGCGC